MSSTPLSSPSFRSSAYLFVEPGKVRKHRKIISSQTNFTATVGLKPEGISNEDEIDHAYHRMQSIYSLFLACYEKAVRSDGTHYPVTVEAPGAKLQIGQGNRDFHAAHVNPGSGIKTNLMDSMKESIAKEGMTPKKIKLFACEHLENKSPNTQLKAFNKAYPHNDFIPPQLRLEINATEGMPRRVNLTVDKTLESPAARQELSELVEKCLCGEMNPEEALQELQKKYQERLAKKLVVFQQKPVSERNKEICDSFQNAILGTVLVTNKEMIGIYDLEKDKMITPTKKEIEQASLELFRSKHDPSLRRKLF